MKNWRRWVLLAAVAGAVAAQIGFKKLDALAGLAGDKHLSMGEISLWPLDSDRAYTQLWTPGTGTAQHIGVHIVIDVFFMLSYSALALVIIGCIRTGSPRLGPFLGKVLPWLLGAVVVVDIFEDVLFGAVAANLGAGGVGVFADLVSALSVVTPVKWVTFALLLAGTGIGIIVICIPRGCRWLRAKIKKA